MEQLTNRIKELEFELESLRAAHADEIQALNQKISQLEETIGDSKAALNLALTENSELKTALEQMPSDTEEIQKDEGRVREIAGRTHPTLAIGQREEEANHDSQ